MSKLNANFLRSHWKHILNLFYFDNFICVWSSILYIQFIKCCFLWISIMILNIKSYLLKIDIYSILVLLIFLAAPLRFYVSTSIILEIVTFGLVVWGFAKHKFTKKIWSPTASKFVVYFFIYFIISSFISYNGFWWGWVC